MKLTKQEAIKLHREMWKRISEMSDEEIEDCGYNIEIIKNKTIKKMNYDPNKMLSLCFCCEYTTNINDSKAIECSSCPLKWPENKSCYNPNGLFRELLHQLLQGENIPNLNSFKKLAKQISELPERRER